MKKITLAILFSAMVLIHVSPAVACHIRLEFDPNPANVFVGDSFSIDLFADIPERKSIVGWGLGLDITNADLLSVPEITIGDTWWATGDSPDLFGGIVGINPPVFGKEVLLATFDFDCLDIGTSYLDLFAEGPMMGFRRAGEVTALSANGIIPMPGDLVRFTYERGVVYQSVPEPATLMLLGAGLVAIAGLGRRFKK